MHDLIEKLKTIGFVALITLFCIFVSAMFTQASLSCNDMITFKTGSSEGKFT